MYQIVGITSIAILPLQSFADLTPKYFMEFLKALLSAVLMNNYVGTVNQVADVEIDKSLAIALSLQSPPLIFGLIVWFLLGTAYSVDKYVLGRPVVITRPLIFAAAIISTISAVMSLLKDIPDEDGDKQFGFQSISSKLGKENVLRLCVYALFFAYGVSVIVGASSSFQLVKLVSIIGHSTLAFLLWLRAQTVDLSNNASTYSFYMFIWKASVIDLFNLICSMLNISLFTSYDENE
ncbi:homogentisate phytyltransferase 1 [Citrus sinensis]|nr:homogentisate phytyltransferase 1 [Citrus sinensis]